MDPALDRIATSTASAAGGGGGALITTSDSAALVGVRGLYVEGAGAIKMTFADGTMDTWNVPANFYIFQAVTKVSGVRPSTTVLSVGEVLFCLSGQWLDGGDLSSLGLTQGTLVIRARCDSVSQNTEIIQTNSAIDGFARFAGTGLAYAGYLMTSRVDGLAGVGTGWSTMFFQISGGHFKRWLNDPVTPDTDQSGVTFSSGSAWKLATGDGSFKAWPGAIAAVYLYNGNLTAPERLSLSNYVGQATG